MNRAATALVMIGVVVMAAGAAAWGGPTLREDAGSSPTATMTPSSGLTAGEVVAITGSGFPPTQPLLITECSGTVADPPTDAGSCTAVVADTNATVGLDGTFTDSPAAGNGTSGYKLEATSQSVNSFACDASHPCLLYVGVQLDDFTQPHVFIPVNWASGVAGTAPSAGGGPATIPPSAANVGPAASLPSSFTSGSGSSGNGGPAGSSSTPAASVPAAPTASVSPAAALPTSDAGVVLANTGSSPAGALIAGVGVLLVAIGAATRHRALRLVRTGL